jgi:hypothetical protein
MNATLALNSNLDGRGSEIEAPLAFRVEAVFLFQFRAIEDTPVILETAF